MRVRLLTCEKLADGIDDDRPLIGALERRGARVEFGVWDAPPPSDPALELVRTTWDYVPKFERFRDWLSAADPARTFNPPALMRWNADKCYLADLEAAGVPVVPTAVSEPGAPPRVPVTEAPAGWVAKPRISAGARGCVRAGSPDELPAPDASASGWLVQPFLPRVLSHGEISLVLIEGEITHCVRKRARPGDYRVQDDHGGTVEAAAWSEAEARVARAAIDALGEAPLYARVDLVDDERGHPVLMELELIEPELFFRFCPSAADRLAAGLLRRAEVMR